MACLCKLCGIVCIKACLPLTSWMPVQIPANLSLQLNSSQSSMWHEDLRRQAMCALHFAQPGSHKWDTG